MLIGGGASILDFVRVAHERPYRLVLSGTRISGLVTVSDLQKLPARAALFGLLTDLELVLQETIREAFDPPEWKRKLSETRLEALDRKIDGAATGGVLIHDELLYTELCDKLDIVRKSLDVELSKKKKRRLVELRDKLAHASMFAESEPSALLACQAVRDALALRTSLRSLSEPTAEPDWAPPSMPTHKDVPDRVRTGWHRRLKGLDEMPAARKRISSPSSSRLGATLGYALCLALAVSTTAAHIAVWSSERAARLFNDLVFQCPYLSSTDHPVHRIWIPFLANAAAVVLAVAFSYTRHHHRDWTWQALLWLLLAAFAAGLVHALTGIPVHFR